MSAADRAPSLPARKVRRELVIAAMLISTFMAAVEVTVISTAMPTIVAELGGFAFFSWAFGAYLLTQAAATPLYGRLADSYGRKRVYLAAAGLFLAGSLLCGCAWSMGSLILFRALQGIGGGDAIAAGVVVGIVTVSWTAASLGMSRILARLSFRPVAIAGSAALAAGSCGLLLVAAGQSAWPLDLACVAIGVGLGLNSLVFTVAVQSGVARGDRGRATALFYFCRLIGQALGAAAFGGVVNRGLEHAAFGRQDIIRDLVSAGRRAALAPAELDRLAGALAEALHAVFLLSGAIALAALVAVLFVPREARLGHED